jgi:hypothetical protein
MSCPQNYLEIVNETNNIIKNDIKKEHLENYHKALRACYL